MMIDNDISSLKSVEDELKDEQNFISTIIDNAQSIIAVINSDGVMKKLNRYGEDFVGYSAKEVASEPYFWKRFLPLNFQHKVESLVENARNGVFDFRRNQNSWFGKNNEERIFEWSNTLVKKDDGSMDYILTVGVDITEQSKQRKIVEEQKKEFETIFKLSKDGISIFNLAGEFLDFNDAYLEMTGYEREELLFLNYFDVTVAEDKQRTHEAIEEVIQNGSYENFEQSYLGRDDRLVQLNMSFALMPDQKRILATAKNITYMKVLESQAKLASMGEMIGNIAHQWRQPLTIISTIASGITLKDQFRKLRRDEITPSMNTIIDQAQYLSTTIDDFKNFIKGDEKKEIFTVASLVEKSLVITRSNLKSSFIEVIDTSDHTIEIEGFENELIQALINIINNAKDALVANEEVLFKKIFISSQIEKDQIILTIKDNAGGIEPSVINRIFEPYFTTKHKSKGTGLGLSMTYKIIKELHQGEISVSNIDYIYENSSYRGACFTISL